CSRRCGMALGVIRLRTNFAERSLFSAQDDRYDGDELIVTLNDIREAQSRLRGVAVRTKLIPSQLHQRDGNQDRRQLFLKTENLQPIGSFKLRGAYNKVASLPEEDRRRGVITYSSGNHGQGVAYAARTLGIKAVIVMPGNVPAVKREATLALG